MIPDSSPFTDPAYIAALERHGCAAPENGWTPRHIDGPRGRVVCYEKAHSWGEFVFDFELARAHRQHGLAYYPKLVACVPFTPVPGARLLAADDAGRLSLARELQAQAEFRHSGAHVLFADPAECALLAADGWIRRVQLRYVWHARGAGSFDDFLARLPGKKRKNIRAERRKLAGFAIGWQPGSSFDAGEWQRVFQLYASTYHMRGQAPYLNLACLQDWAAHFGERLQFCVARQAGEMVAMAFFFEDGDTLYGRHWGADASYDGLHFELCYYQGIERCLARGLKHFDAGVQGEHKLARGFEIELAHSAHWFTHRGFHDAIARAFEHERVALQRHVAEAAGDTERGAD
ncbi:GNAT family N-acetyltransferase [Solimonas terrae]|uniref:GNAT family N-acetyltransferase n=1 Tax=Solimonas terrae TaxID=1396819 RepID=A0A6M2BU96_9GAMM|nr:GNAT family N-acetyltransferase [Solimonas terrae]